MKKSKTEIFFYGILGIIIFFICINLSNLSNIVYKNYIDISNNTIDISDININISAVHGELFYHNDTNPLIVNIPTNGTYFKVTGFFNGTFENVLLFNDSFVIQKEGVYSVETSVSFSGGTNRQYEYEIHLNNQPTGKCEFHRKMGTGGDVGSASITCQLELEENDTLDIRVEDETFPTADVSMQSINFNINKISGFINTSNVLTGFLKNDGDNATGDYNFNGSIGVGDITTPINDLQVYPSSSGKGIVVSEADDKTASACLISGANAGGALTCYRAGNPQFIYNAISSSEWNMQNVASHDYKFHGSSNNLLYLDSGLNSVGINTIPDASSILHIKDGTTNANTMIYSENDVQTWSMGTRGANGDNFMIRDITGTASSPFTITKNAPSWSFLIASDGYIGVGTFAPSYPIHVVGNNSGISIYSEGNISATGYITRTDVYDKQTNALDEIKDKSFYVNLDNSINHKNFGYSSVKYNKSVIDYYIDEIVIHEEFNETLNKIVNVSEVYKVPVTKIIEEEGIDLVREVAMLKQAIYELKIQVEVLQK